MTAQYDYQIGTALGTMTNLETIFASTRGIYTAKADPVDYSQPTRLGDGSLKGNGWLETTWHFDYLSLTNYNLLKAYCPALSSNVYIKTRNNAGTFAIYTATMLWPEKEPERGSSSIVMDISIKFIKLVAQ